MTVELKTLVQGKDGLSVEKINEFVSSCGNAKLVLIYSSLRDDFECVGFFDGLVKKLEVPFIASRVLCSFTSDGYFEDSVVVGVLCGDFEVRVHGVNLDFNAPEDAVESILPHLEGSSLCLTYSSILTRDLIYVNRVLTELQKSHPKMQFAGGNSSPSPIVATNEGVFEGYLACALIKGCGFDFWWESGFGFAKDGREFRVTKTDDYHVLEINDKNAVEVFTQIQHIQPYFLNMISNLVCKMEANKMIEKLAKASEVMYKAIINFCIRGLGWDDAGVVDSFSVIQIDDEGLITATKIPTGSILRKMETSKEMQLNLYDELASKSKKAAAVLANSCIFRLMYLEYDKKSIQEKLEKIKCPFIDNYMHGELGNYTPYDPKKSLTHGATTNAMIFK